MLPTFSFYKYSSPTRPIYKSASFLRIILQILGHLPLQVKVRKLKETFVSRRKKALYKFAEQIRQEESKLQEETIKRDKRRNEKIKKKLLAKPYYNKLISAELDIDLSVHEEVEEEEDEEKEIGYESFLKKNEPNWLLRIKSASNTPIEVLYRTLANRSEAPIIIKNKRLLSRIANSIDLKKKRKYQQWSYLNTLPLMKFSTLLKDYNLNRSFPILPERPTNINPKNRNSDKYMQKCHITSVSEKLAKNIFNSLIKGESLRLRRLFATKGAIRDLTRKRSIALVLFVALCNKWFFAHNTSSKFAKIIIFSLFRYIYILESNASLNSYMSQILEFFISTTFLQFKVRRIKYDFFLLSNDSINAAFLARFIANKFRQNLSVRKVLNPLLTEFRRVTSMYSYDTHLTDSARQSETSIYRLRLALQRSWGQFFKYSLDCFSAFSRDHAFGASTWFSLDALTHLIWFNRMHLGKKQIRYLTIYFAKRMNSFLMTYISDSNKWFIDLSIITLPEYTINPSAYVSRNNCMNSLISHIIISPSFFEKIDRFRRLHPFILKLASRNYYRFLKYNYWMVNYKLWHTIKGFNYLKARQRVEETNNILFRGFKIHCLGRFSRRQRSKSFWVNIGMVPLGTIGADIDYGHYTIPIKNSLISIKVWINMVSSNGGYK